MFRIVFWDVRTSETLVDNYFTRQYIPEDNSEHLFINVWFAVNFYTHLDHKWINVKMLNFLAIIRYFPYDLYSSSLKEFQLITSPVN
jgi:hypothetical protein